MANCCNNISCDQVVTIGYLNQLINNQTLSGCASSFSHDPLTSCCGEINGTAYTPTYGELTSGTYPIRVVDSHGDASNDVNGFVFSQPIKEGNNCCQGSVNDMLLNRSSVRYEVTKVTGVSADTSNITTLSGCNCSKTINWVGQYTRYSGECSANTIVTKQSEANAYSGAASSITITFDYSGQHYYNSGSSSASVTVPSAETSFSAISYDSCNNYVCIPKKVRKKAVDFEATMELVFEGEKIPCEGATIIFNKSGDCSLSDFDYDIYTISNEVEEYYTGGTTSYSASTPQNDTGWDSIKISAHTSNNNVCGATVELELINTFEQEKCKKVVTLDGCDPFSQSIEFDDAIVRGPKNDTY